MRSSRIRSAYQIFVGVLILVSVCIQFFYGLIHTPVAAPYIETFFSYFTIISNIFVGIVFCCEAFLSLKKQEPSAQFDSIRGAAVFFILTTGVVYGLFLHGPMGQEQIEYSLPIINSIFHQIVPVVAILDWIIFPPKHRLNWTTLFGWLGLTIIYAVLVELGGLLTNTYPYFFLNPTFLGGYNGVLRACMGFIPFLLVFSLFVLVTARANQWLRPSLR
jgi:hypothetical protein